MNLRVTLKNNTEIITKVPQETFRDFAIQFGKIDSRYIVTEDALILTEEIRSVQVFR